jgi:hypothetical protein
MGVRFKLSQTYRTDVNFDVFDERGKREHLSFLAQFKRLDKEAVKDLVESSKKPGADDTSLLKEVLTGWVLVDLATNDPVPFTPEAFEEFCAIPGAAGLTMLRFFATVGAAREGN